MARILFLSQLLPLPLDAGPKIRAYYVLRHLAEAGHEVTLLCFVRQSDKASDVRALGEFYRGDETVPLRRSRSKDLWDGMRSLTSDAPFLILRDGLYTFFKASADFSCSLMPRQNPETTLKKAYHLKNAQDAIAPP